MSSKSIINALQTMDDLNAVAEAVGMSVSALKKVLIESLGGGVEQEAKVVEVAEDIDEDYSDSNASLTSSGEDGEDAEAAEEEEKSIFDQVIEANPTLSDEQINFLDVVVRQGRSVLLSAAAGSGKSFAIGIATHILESTQPQHPNPSFGICAPTGKAASLLKGARTLHSYFGIGLARGEVSDWVKRTKTAFYMRNTLETLRAVQTIIIDEISMVSAELLDQLDEYLQELRGCRNRFGGIQMILVGDLGQLGPVSGQFVFKSKAYQACNFAVLKFTKSFRQLEGPFLDILNQLRMGECSQEAFDILKAQQTIDPEFAENMRATKILSTNSEVDTINERELQRQCRELRTQPTVFNTLNDRDPKRCAMIRKSAGIPEFVKLVEGAQVIVTFNISPPSVVNGSQGTILSMTEKRVVVKLLGVKLPVVIEYLGFKDPAHPDIFTAKVLFDYMPLRLGYACTVHKAQGATLALADVDLTHAFCHGQGYCAISRCRSLNGLIVRGMKAGAFICDPEIKKFLTS